MCSLLFVRVSTPCDYHAELSGEIVSFVYNETGY